MKGEDLLRHITKLNSKTEMMRVNHRVYCFVGYGSSNATAIIGETSIIMVDAFGKPANAKDAMSDLAKVTDKPVGTIIYTHSHVDHTGGSGYFRGFGGDIIAFSPFTNPPARFSKISNALTRRAVRQFGFGLTDEECLSMGLGPRESGEGAEQAPDVLSASTVYDEEKVSLLIDGVRIELIRAPGEADDGIIVWLPDDGVVCSADNYYACWPNLYAIRGSNYRDVATWIDSLSRTLDLKPSALIPGHSDPLIGESFIQEQVGTYRDAIDYVLNSTLECIDKCMSVDEAVQAVKLPEKWCDLPFLAECYGTIEWSVRSIYGGYVGWFDGDPTTLVPLPLEHYRKALLEMIGYEQIVARIEKCISEEDYQLGLELLDLVEEPRLKKACLIGRARQMTSANARHYLWSCAKEIDA